MDVFPARDREYMRDLELPPRKARGWVHEVEMPMRTGDVVHYESTHAPPGARVEFNIHSHKGKEVTYHAKSSEASVEGGFTAPWEGKFYVMVENVSGEAIRLRLRAMRHEVHEGPVAEGEGHHG